MLEKIPQMYEIFYENRDYLDQAAMISLAYTRMAEHYAELSDTANALNCIELALEHAKMVDEYSEGLDNSAYGISNVWDYPQLPNEKRHTSILANPDFDYPTTTIWFGKDRESQVQCCSKAFSHKRFDFFRDQIEKITK